MGTTTRRSAFLPLLTIAAAAHGQSLYVFEPAAGYQSTVGYGLSDDGTTLAGWLALGGGGGNEKGFLGSTTGYRDDFGLRSGIPIQTVVQGISGDGTYAVGASRPIGGSATAFRYNTTTGVHQSLGLFSGMRYTQASDANRDGSVVVGWGTRADGFTTQAFRWSQATGYQAIGGWSQAYAVSGDGSVVVGANEGRNGTEAFRWTTSGGLETLEMPNGGRAEANGLSSDGRIAVGTVDTGQGFSQAGMWVDGDLEILGRVLGRGTSATHTSGDGSLVGGRYSAPDTGFQSPFVWTRSFGMETMADFFARFGVFTPEGWTFSSCDGISADGRSISGNMYEIANASNGRAFIATIPSPSVLVTLTFGLCAVRRTRRRTILG